MKQIKLVLIISFFKCLYCHDVKDDFIKWKQYLRFGGIIENNEIGVGTYFRFNRTTKNTFKDLRLFAHYISSGNSYIKLRYKDSDKFISFNQLYRFTVVSFDRNEKIGLNIRSHGSQGIGYFLLKYLYGHINTELSFSYDMMDHLNDTRKTSYLKMGVFWDNDISLFETKMELEYIYQISDIVDNDFSRLELLFELYYPITNEINLIAGYEMEDFFNQKKNGYSYFLSIGYKKVIDWKF